jgi:hypothetical protein
MPGRCGRVLDIDQRSHLCSPEPMNESELEQCYATHGVERDITREALWKAYLQKSYALIRRSADDAERERLGAAHDRLAAHLEAQESARQAAPPVKTGATGEPPPNPIDPLSFDSPLVNALAPPLVAGLAIVVSRTPLGFLLQGFHVWIHEFGHAIIGWMTGHRALPLPIGWTPISLEKSNFVYFGLLFLLVLMFVAGARERKIWPMVLAVVLAMAQAYMTWRLPQATAEMWIAFGGVGGELYLSAAMPGLATAG